MHISDIDNAGDFGALPSLAIQDLIDELGIN